MKTLKLLIAWTWIIVPLGWGVYNSVMKSLPLFGVRVQAVTKTADAPKK